MMKYITFTESRFNQYAKNKLKLSINFIAKINLKTQQLFKEAIRLKQNKQYQH